MPSLEVFPSVGCLVQIQCGSFCFTLYFYLVMFYYYFIEAFSFHRKEVDSDGIGEEELGGVREKKQ